MKFIKTYVMTLIVCYLFVFCGGWMLFDFSNRCYIRILPFDVSNPVMLTSLATLLLLRGAEYKNSRDKIGFYLTCTAAIFVYAVVVYVVLVSRI